MKASHFLYLSIALAGILLFAWQDRRRELHRLQEDWQGRQTQGDTESRGPGQSWLAELLPDPADATSSEVQPSQPEFPIQGLDELGDAQLREVVLREAQRWQASPTAPLDQARMEVAEDQTGFAVLSFRGSGTDAATLAWLQHLLASPAGSDAYLTDPARIDVVALEPSGLRLQADVRIWPNSLFLTEMEGLRSE